jgi:hypothetical protein
METAAAGDSAKSLVSLLTFAEGWAEGWLAAGRGDTTVRWERSPDDRPKRAVWVSVQGNAAWGQLTVWESGEVHVEAMDTETGVLVLSDDRFVGTAAALSAELRSLVARCG